MALKRKRYSKKPSSKRRFKKRQAYRRKRTWRKRSRGTGAVQRSMPSANFLPQKCLVSLTYKHQHTLDASTGTPVSYSYSANGAYDADQTGTGFNLPGYLTYADFYSYYCVIASQIKVTVLQNGAQGSYLSIELNDAATPSTTNLRDIWGQRNFSSKVLTANNEKVHVVKKGFSIKKNTGISSPLTHLPLQAVTNAAPSWFWRYHLVHQGTTSSLDPSYITYMCTITYRIIFLTPKNQPQQ